MRRWIPVPLLALLAVACDDGTMVQPEPALGRGIMASDPIVVMSRNLYLGADIDALLDPNADPGTVLGTALGQVLQTDFRVRAQALAQEIHDRAPHLVGLQEVTSYAVTLDDFTTVVPVLGFPLDFLGELVDALADLGDTYVVAQRTQNVILPFSLEAVDDDYAGLYIVYSDADAILARDDVATANPAGGQFPTQQYLMVGGTVFENKRGYGTVDATVNGRTLRFGNTHLEIQLFADVQEQQARELAGILAASPLPVILVGDFNSAANPDAPDASRTDSYHILKNAGYKDLWLREPHSNDGVTCCQAAGLTNTTSQLTQRLDIVFARWGRAGFGGQSAMEIVGEEPGDIIIHPLGYPLWPSDHAGVAAWLWPAR